MIDGTKARVVVVVVLLVGLSGAVALPTGLAWPARASLLAFGGATVFWTLTRLSAAYVALTAALFLVAVRAIDQQALFDGLRAKVVWLVIGTFILGAAVEKSGLAGRLTTMITGRGTTVGALLWRMTFGIIPLAFLIPSTSGRAAVLLPLFRNLTDADNDRRIARAIGLLIPVVILMSTISSLVGAGSHLIANDLLEQMSGQRITFGQWMLWGLPFGVAASLLATFAIGRLFLDRDTRARPVAAIETTRGRLSGAEWRTAFVVLVMLALWVTEGLHPFGIATVALAGAVVLTMPVIGVLDWNQGIAAVSWSLVLFVAAALVLGKALISTGAAHWLIDLIVSSGGFAASDPIVVVLLGLILIGLTSHIYMVSHTARVAALLPPLLLLGHASNLNAVTVAFLANVGMDYCITLPVSSKALLIFQDIDRETWTPTDLLKLSAVLSLAYAALMIATYFAFWRFVGLAL